MNPDSGSGLKGTPLASAVFCHTLLEVCKLSSHARFKIGGLETHVFPHQLSSMPPVFGSVNMKNIMDMEIAVPASRATARM